VAFFRCLEAHHAHCVHGGHFQSELKIRSVKIVLLAQVLSMDLRVAPFVRVERSQQTPDLLYVQVVFQAYSLIKQGLQNATAARWLHILEVLAVQLVSHVP
jgi:hypothetical protein